MAAELAMDRTTLTKNLKPLERRGLVTSTVDPWDARSRVLTVTPEGKDVLAEAIPLWQRAQSDTLSALADPDALRNELRTIAFAD